MLMLVLEILMATVLHGEDCRFAVLVGWTGVVCCSPRWAGGGVGVCSGSFILESCYRYSGISPPLYPCVVLFNTITASICHQPPSLALKEYATAVIAKV